MVGVKYYSQIWYLHTTGLLRYHGPQENWKRPRKFSKAVPKATLQFYLNFIIFLLYILYLKNIEILYFYPIFWPNNSATWRNLVLKAIKTKKTAIRPNVAKLDCCKFKGQTMVPQYPKRSFKVPWRPIRMPFWEMTTLNQKSVPRVKKLHLTKISKNQ